MSIKDLQCLQAPHVTEKTSRLTAKSNQYAFKVSLEATKLSIKKSIEEYFSVVVEDIQVIKVKGKTRRDRKSNKLRKKSNWKKAYVTLAEGNSIDMEIVTE